MEQHASTATKPNSIPVDDCYQCGKCTAGCPMSESMDLMPNQIIRLAQIGQEQRILESQAIWLCVACQTCSTRCPKSVDIAGVMDEMRQLSIEKGAASPAQQRTILFQLAFLQNIRRFGRTNEMELIRVFKTSVFFKDLNIPMLFKDAMLGPEMLKRRKLHLSGEKVRDRQLVARIFQRCTK